MKNDLPKFHAKLTGIVNPPPPLREIILAVPFAFVFAVIYALLKTF